MAARIRSGQEDREFQQYIEALLTSGSDTQVLEKIAGLDVPAPYRVRLKVMYSSRFPAKVLDSLAEKHLVKRLTRASTTYVYEARIGQKHTRHLRVPFLLAGFDQAGEQVKTIIAICESDQWSALRRFIKRRYPSLVPILLSQAELIRGARALTKITGHEVRVRAFSAKETVRGLGGTLRKSVREWTDEELETVLRDIEDRRQTLTSLDVDLYPTVGQYSHVRPKASCKIRKDGEIAVSGSFKLAFEAVAAQVARVGVSKLNFYRGRGLRESNYKPQPVAITFSRAMFDDIKTVQIFVSLLGRYPHSIHATTHGNPYANVRVTDLLDGSSFDVWAIPPQKIALVPGLKATEAAFERIVHYIFEGFREGQVSTYDREGRTLEIPA